MLSPTGGVTSCQRKQLSTISYICWLDIIIIYFHFANDESKNKGIQMPYQLILAYFTLQIDLNTYICVSKLTREMAYQLQE